MLDRFPKRKCVYYPECSFQRIDYQAVLDHQEDCRHRRAPCGNCGNSVAISSLNIHLKDKHGEREVPNNKYWELGFENEAQKMLQGPPGNQFYFNKILFKDNMMIWVSYNGSRKDKRKYQFSIKMVDEDNQTVLSGTKFCVPCDMSRDVIKDKFLGVVINKDLAQEISTENWTIGEIDNTPLFRAKVQVFLATGDQRRGTNRYGK